MKFTDEQKTQLIAQALDDLSGEHANEIGRDIVEGVVNSIVYDIRNILTFQELSKANADRQKEWVGGDKIDLTFIGLEIGEEAGEVQGALKKIIRAQKGIAGNHHAEGNQDRIIKRILIPKLESELGDLVINASRLANAVGIDLSKCIREKFNATSEKLKMETWL
jgi:NTP pyrophosphatase (non-canonical NTP hydrolase)